MRLFSTLLLLPMVALPGLVPGFGATAATLENGDFESPELPADSGGSFATGSDALSGWSIRGNGGPVSLLNGSPGPQSIGPYSGSQYLTFNAGNSPPGTYIQQSIATQADERYELSFALGRIGVGAGDVRLTVVVTAPDGTALLIAELSQLATGWAEHTLSFVATATASTLSIVDASSATDQVDVALDGIMLVGCAPGPKQINMDQVQGLAAWLETNLGFPSFQSRFLSYFIVWYATPAPPSPCD